VLVSPYVDVRDGHNCKEALRMAVVVFFCFFARDVRTGADNNICVCVLMFLTELVLIVRMFLTELVLTVLIFLTELVLTVAY
jgi:hypothetical protein